MFGTSRDDLQLSILEQSLHTVYCLCQRHVTIMINLAPSFIVLAPCIVVLFCRLSSKPHEHKHKVNQSPILSAPNGIHVH